MKTNHENRISIRQVEDYPSSRVTIRQVDYPYWSNLIANLQLDE